MPVQAEMREAVCLSALIRHFDDGKGQRGHVCTAVALQAGRNGCLSYQENILTLRTLDNIVEARGKSKLSVCAKCVRKKN